MTLNAAGVLLTPPNHDTPPARAKIGIPQGDGTRRWYRVGFGEGIWIWLDTGVVTKD